MWEVSTAAPDQNTFATAARGLLASVCHRHRWATQLCLGNELQCSNALRESVFTTTIHWLWLLRADQNVCGLPFAPLPLNWQLCPSKFAPLPLSLSLCVQDCEEPCEARCCNFAGCLPSWASLLMWPRCKAASAGSTSGFCAPHSGRFFADGAFEGQRFRQGLGGHGPLSFTEPCGSRQDRSAREKCVRVFSAPCAMFFWRVPLPGEE